MIGDVFNLLAATLTTLGACVAALLLVGTAAPAAAIWAAVLAIIGSACWIAAAVAAIVERRKGRR
jgi:hypothetical protein